MHTPWQAQIRQQIDPHVWQTMRTRLAAAMDADIRSDRLLDDYYLPLYFRLHAHLVEHPRKPLFVGLNAPQGAGKTTLTHWLVRMLEWAGLRAVNLSIDDFYLPREEQIRLAGIYPDNPYLQQRGYPGTHDIALGLETLTRLQTPRRQTLQTPRYDKSRHQGQGDRLPREQWPVVTLPVDVVILEGWMLGFEPLSAEVLADDRALGEINALLGHYQAWLRFMDLFIHLHPDDPMHVVNWRIEAERRMKAGGLPGMSEAEVRTYAEKFLPAYRLYGPRLAARPPSDNHLRLTLGRDRLPL